MADRGFGNIAQRLGYVSFASRSKSFLFYYSGMWWCHVSWDCFGA